jgi:hypothetical protein
MPVITPLRLTNILQRRKAVHAENFALAEYHGVLHSYNNLTVKGVIPDEGEWLRSRTVGNGGDRI